VGRNHMILGYKMAFSSIPANTTTNWNMGIPWG
jgi:hypothetical protein